MNEEKEIITFEDLYQRKNEPSKKERREPEHKRSYIYTLLVYATIMYVVATIIVLVMLQLPSMTEEISEAEVLINSIANDENSLALITPDTWYAYRDDYKDYVTSIGYYEDYLVMVNTANTNVEETLFTAIDGQGTLVFDPLKLEQTISFNPAITSWANGEDIELYRSTNLPVPPTFQGSSYVIQGPQRIITDTASALLNFLIYILLLPGIIYFMKSDLSYDFTEFKSKKTEVIIPIIVGYAYVWVGNIVASFLSTYLSNLLGIQMGEAANQQAIISATSSSLGILMVISAVLIGPVIEELVFRKALFGLIKKDSIALLVSTLVFGLIHVVSEPSITEALINGSSYFIMGFVFGYIYIKSDRNIMIPIVVHIINNAVSILFIFLLF